MYRAISWYFTKKEINYANKIELQESLKDISIFFKSKGKLFQDVYINNHCVTEEIRSQEVSSIVSSIATIREVRDFLVDEQQKIGASGGLVAEGRDIGTQVFPNAELKIFLTASIDERAKRRKLELEKKGDIKIDFEELKDQIKKRDLIDSTREISPLKKAKDAFEISTDGFSVDEIVQKIIDLYIDNIPEEVRNLF